MIDCIPDSTDPIKFEFKILILDLLVFKFNSHSYAFIELRFAADKLVYSSTSIILSYSLLDTQSIISEYDINYINNNIKWYKN